MTKFTVRQFFKIEERSKKCKLNALLFLRQRNKSRSKKASYTSYIGTPLSKSIIFFLPILILAFVLLGIDFSIISINNIFQHKTAFAEPTTEPKSISAEDNSSANNSLKIEKSDSNTRQDLKENETNNIINNSKGEIKNNKITKESKQSKSSNNISSIAPKAEPDGKFFIDDYQDPSLKQDNRSFLVKAFYTVVDIIKYAVYLAIVLAIGLAAIYGVKLFSTKYGSFASNSGELLNILEVKYLSPGKALFLVEVADKILVLSAAGNNINYLSEITDPDKVNFLKQSAEKRAESVQSFKSILDRFSKRLSKASTKNYQQAVSANPSSLNFGHASSQTEEHWKNDLHATGENIRKLLEEIKEQDRVKRRSQNKKDSSRGEKHK